MFVEQSPVGYDWYEIHTTYIQLLTAVYNIIIYYVRCASYGRNSIYTYNMYIYILVIGFTILLFLFRWDNFILSTLH